MCYVFRNLMEGISSMATPSRSACPFHAYLEIPKLNDYGLNVVEIEQSSFADGRHSWQYPDEIDKLADPKIKAFSQ